MKTHHSINASSKSTESTIWQWVTYWTLLEIYEVYELLSTIHESEGLRLAKSDFPDFSSNGLPVHGLRRPNPPVRLRQAQENSRKLETNKTCYPAWKYPEAKWRQTTHPKEKGREPWSIFFLGKMRDVYLQKGKTSQKSTEIINSHFMYQIIYIYMTGKQATLLFQVQCPEAETIFCRKQLIPPRTQRALRQIQAELELLPSLPRLLPWPPSMRRICRINATVTNENGVQKFTKITWQRTSLLVIVVK